MFDVAPTELMLVAVIALVVLPATLTFNTGAPEIMECVAGSCEYKLAGTDAWVKSVAGEKFNVPGNSSFEIRVTEPYHYICHFG